MSLGQGLLKGTQSREWVVAKPPTGASPQWVYTGRDESGLGPIYVALASISVPPSRETMRALHAAYKGKSNIQLVVGAVLGNQIWIFGPDEKTEVTEPLALDQGCRQLQSALDEPDAIAAYTRLGQFRRSLDTTSLVGVTNSGLFASYHLRENVPKRQDWKASCEKAKSLLALRNEHLIKALGFKSEKTAGNALLLTTGTPQSKAVAILLDETEQFDATSARHTGISPVAFGLNVAARQSVPWLFVLRKDQIRIYPAKDGIGVGQKGQVETYLEIDLAAIDSERAGLLTLIFSAEALEPNGTANDLLQGSQLFASQLGSRLRERIYEHVVPQLSKSVAEHLREQGTNLDSEGLSLAYRLTLRILFRLLFQAYAEDRGLLPSGRNEGYDANSLKTIAKRIKDSHTDQFGKSKTLWFDLVQVWDAIDEGNETWNVPAYNGGLFGTDPEIHPDGALIEKLGIQDDILGPVLQHLLIDISEDGVLGPVDFRSLSVREFGTIYEGLLESSLSVATQDLTVDSKGSWIPAANLDNVIAITGDVYFHSASGERKATGSYFTPSVVVDSLITETLDPALDAHLDRIKGHLLKGDLSSAARDFFDFRVADLAMGSGHFLVAAVDRIEAKMRMFLAEKETAVPGISAELHRLAQAAKSALGNDESALGEIEPAALLRRQIARRCIYGLDINPLAVELSRLAIWIHTFVPGLPMSSLDHGLVCANSLAGIGTIEEALQALQPDLAGNPLKPGHARLVSVFENVITDNLESTSRLLLEVANSDEASKSEVKAASLISKKARVEAESTRQIFNAAVAARLGFFDARNIFDEAGIAEVGSRKEVAEAISLLNPAHLPFLFPEVFVRNNPGFDVLIGNPPWEKLHVKEDIWWALRFPGLMGMNVDERTEKIKQIALDRPDLRREIEHAKTSNDLLRQFISTGNTPGIGAAHLDLFAVFAWRNWRLLRANGKCGIVLPRTAHTGSSLSEWRKEILRLGSFEKVTFLVNTSGWIFEGVHGQYGIGLTVFSKNQTGVLKVSGPFSTREDFVSDSNHVNEIQNLEFLSWSPTAAFPMLPTAKSVEILLTMRGAPSLNEHVEFEYQPVQGDFNVTSDKQVISKNKTANHTYPVFMGSAYNLWNSTFGEPYGFVGSDFLDELLSRAKRGSTTNRSAYAGMTVHGIQDLAMSKARIAFRLITNQTNTRTGIFCLVPPGVVLGHGSPFLFRRRGSAITDAYLLGILSSIPFDWYARRWVELNFTFELLKPMPIPLFDSADSRVQKVIELASSMAFTDDSFKQWIKETGVNTTKRSSENPQPADIAELDAICANLYGLSRDQLVHIFETFHRGWNYTERLAMTLKFFDEWSSK
jgi:hypothetical protein